METFTTVTALYMALRGTPGVLRVKRSEYRQDGIEALPLDFVLDIETKTKRTVGQFYYDMFLRAAFNQDVELLPDNMKLTLGRTWKEYGLDVDGAYAKLYFVTKNEQVRNALKEMTYGCSEPVRWD